MAGRRYRSLHIREAATLGPPRLLRQRLFLLQIRVAGREWQTNAVAVSRAKAAMAASAVVDDEIANGSNDIAVRVISDAQAAPPAR